MNLQIKSSFVLFFVGAAVLLAVTVSCKKSSSPGSTGSLSATVGTGSFRASTTEAVYSASITSFQVVGLSVVSGDSLGMVVTFSTPFPLNTTISADSTTLEVEYADQKSGAIYIGSGLPGSALLMVTTYDSVNHKIAGSFSGVLYNNTGGSDSVVVSNGKFSSGYAVTN